MKTNICDDCGEEIPAPRTVCVACATAALNALFALPSKPSASRPLEIGDSVYHRAYGKDKVFTISDISCVNDETVYKAFSMDSESYLTVTGKGDDFELIEIGLDDEPITQKFCIKHEEGSTPISLAEKQNEVWVICKNCGHAIRPVAEKPVKVWRLPSDWPV